MAKYLTPEEIADKQIRNAQNNVDAAKAGVERTKKKPMEEAIRQIPKTKANFNKAVDDGSLKRGLEGVNHSDWVADTVRGFDERYVNGLENSRNKQIAFQEQRAAYISRTQAAIDAMPTDTESQKDAKMVANRKRMEGLKFQKRLRK